MPGVIEDRIGSPTREFFEKIKKEIYARAERLCKTRLNGVNLFKAVNEHAISLVNYHVGVLKLGPSNLRE